MDIHEYERRYQAALRGIERSSLSDRNKELVLEYKEALVLECLSKPRVIKYLEVLKNFCSRLKLDMDKAKEKDIRSVISDIQQANYSPWTKQTYKVIIRRFYKWLLKAPGKEYPSIVSWISIRMSKSEMKLPSEGDLLKEEDVKKLLDAADHPRDKAYISVLWESGARIGEIGNLQLKHVVFDKYGIFLTVIGKTGSRKIRLIASTPHMATWLSIHPDKNNKSAPLWVNIGCRDRNKMMQYKNMRELLRLLFRKAGIQKRHNPHIFRHSRATFMANHLTEFQMNQYFGWVQGSDMPSTYVHLSGREVDDAILAMNGIKTDKKESEHTMQPRICPRCDTINTADANHCNKCGGILDAKTAMEIEEKQKKESAMRERADIAMDKLFKDKSVQEFLAGKMKELGITP